MSTSARGVEEGAGFLSSPQKALYEDFWSRLAAGEPTAGENIEGHPALKLVESWHHADEMAKCVAKDDMTILLSLTGKARAAFECGGPAAWVHLLVARKRLSLPATSISLDSDQFQLLLDAATLCVHANIAIRSVDEARSMLRIIESLIDIEANWKAPAQSALLLHALDRIASFYRSQLECRTRSWLAPLLASLLRVVFVSHRHFWAELNRWSAIQETPLDELANEFTRIDALKASGRKLQDRLREAARNAQLGNENLGALADILNSILNSISGQAKSSNLSQHTLLAVHSEGGHDSDRMPYRERLQHLAPLEHWIFDKEYGWHSEKPRNWEEFKKLLENAFGRGWPRNYLSLIFPSLTGSDPQIPSRRQGSLSDTAWTIDGEFSLLVILIWRMQRTATSDPCPHIALTERQLLPSFAKESASNAEVHWLPADLETLLTKSLGLFDEDDAPTARFWSFYNFLEHETLRSNKTIPCGESCSFKILIEKLYASMLLIEGPPSRLEICRLINYFDIPNCCGTTDNLMQHSRLESLLLELLLREGRRLPTSLFLMPLLRAEWPNQGHYPLAVYAGTLMGLESDHWPHVTARANAHLSAIYDAIQPVIELVVAQVLVEYVSHLRQTRDILQDATGRFLQDLDEIDSFDKALPARTKDAIGLQLLKALNEFSVRRGKKLSDMGVRLTVAMAAALGEEDGGQDISQRLLERLRTITQDAIAEGGLSSAWILEALNGFRKSGDIQALMDARISGTDHRVKLKDFFRSFKIRLIDPRTCDNAVSILESLVLRPAWELGRFIARTSGLGHLSPLVPPEQKEDLKHRINEAWSEFPEVLKSQGPGRALKRIVATVNAAEWERAADIWIPMRIDNSDRFISKLQEWIGSCSPSTCTLLPINSNDSLLVKNVDGDIETGDLDDSNIFPPNVMLPCPYLQMGNGQLVDAIKLLLLNRDQQCQPPESYNLAVGWHGTEYCYLRLYYKHPEKRAFNRLLKRISEHGTQSPPTEWQTKTVPLWRLLGQWVSIILTVDSRCYELGRGWREENTSDQVSIEFRLTAYQKITNGHDETE